MQKASNMIPKKNFKIAPKIHDIMKLTAQKHLKHRNFGLFSMAMLDFRGCTKISGEFEPRVFLFKRYLAKHC